MCSPSSQCVPQHVLHISISLLSHMLWQMLFSFHLCIRHGVHTSYTRCTCWSSENLFNGSGGRGGCRLFNRLIDCVLCSGQLGYRLFNWLIDCVLCSGQAPAQGGRFEGCLLLEPSHSEWFTEQKIWHDFNLNCFSCDTHQASFSLLASKHFVIQNVSPCLQIH
jgi:hypothetical protein